MPDQPESFNEQTWKDRIRQRLQGWSKPAAHTLYGFLATMSLFPVVEALQRGQFEALTKLGGVTAGIGAGLITNLVWEWARDDKSQDEVISELEALAQQDEEIREALDAIMTKLEVMQMAEAGLDDEDRAWFVQTLRDELQKLGNWEKYDAVLMGKGFIQQGSDNVGATDRGVAIRGSVSDAFINTGKIVFEIYRHPPGKGKLSEDDFQRILEEYLKWVELAHAQARLYGLESLRTAKDKPVRQLADVFVPLTLREFTPPERREIETLAREAYKGDPWAERKAYLALAREKKTEGVAVDLRQLLTTHDKLAIIGGAGSGKSTLLHYLAVRLAQHALRGASPPFALPKGRERLIPLVIPLRYFTQYRKEVQASPGSRLQEPRTGTLAGFIPWYLKGRSPALEASEDFFNRLLLGGGCLLMLDGLDEIVRDKERGWMRQEVENLVHDIYPGNIVIVTAREAGYRGDAIFGDDFQRLDVQPLEEAQIETLVRNWCQQLYPDEVERQTDQLMAAINDINARYRRQNLPPLIETPLMTTMVISVQWGETDLPRERAKLYEAAVRVILQAQYLPSDEVREALTGSWEEHRDWLAHLALAMHSRGEGSAVITEDQLRGFLAPIMSQAQLDAFVRMVRARGGLLEERADLFQFIHLTFQEFLAARFLAKQREAAWPLLKEHVDDAWWREVFLLTYGFAKTDYAPYAQQFLDWLSDLPEVDDATRLNGLELAAAAVLEIERPDPELRLKQAQRLAAAVTHPQWRTPPTLRSRAANTLARLGDPRPGVGLNAQGLPDILWSEPIEPGPFPMGNTKETDPMAWDDEAPRFTCNLITEPYRISVYPITVAQYRAFVKDAKGYEKRQYWTDAGWKWREKNEISGPREFGEPFNLDNHPQVGVSWYEAVAFCNWLSEVMGLVIQLPTEAQWERAARHTDGRRYPWAKGLAAPDPNRMNYRDTGIGATSAVGIFPAGGAVCGAQDLNGNVWEWCRTKWRNNYESYEQEVNDTLEGGAMRVIRGGSFDDNASYVRAAFGGGATPFSRGNDIGFRVVLLPSFPSEIVD